MKNANKSNRKIMIYFLNEQNIFPVTYKQKILIRRAVEATLAYEGYSNFAEISLTLTDNEGIQALNRKYRGKDAPTDVLSFPLIDFDSSDTPPANDPENSLGDIVISLERAREQANLYGHSEDREIAFLTVHSMLHLLGYDHEISDDELDMRARQSEILKSMGLDINTEAK